MPVIEVSLKWHSMFKLTEKKSMGIWYLTYLLNTIASIAGSIWKVEVRWKTVQSYWHLRMRMEKEVAEEEGVSKGWWIGVLSSVILCRSPFDEAENCLSLKGTIKAMRMCILLGGGRGKGDSSKLPRRVGNISQSKSSCILVADRGLWEEVMLCLLQGL